jgi:hypothetical protein
MPRTICPFECDWVSGEVPTHEGARLELCAHLSIEHHADPERDERAWESLVNDLEAEASMSPEHREVLRAINRQLRERQRRWEDLLGGES